MPRLCINNSCVTNEIRPPLERCQADARAALVLSQLIVMQQGFLTLVFPTSANLPLWSLNLLLILDGLFLLSIQLAQHLIVVSVSWLQPCTFRCCTTQHVSDAHTTTTRTCRARLGRGWCFAITSNRQDTRRIVAMRGLRRGIACLRLVAIAIRVIAGGWVGLVAHR